MRLQQHPLAPEPSGSLTEIAPGASVAPELIVETLGDSPPVFGSLFPGYTMLATVEATVLLE